MAAAVSSLEVLGSTLNWHAYENSVRDGLASLTNSLIALNLFLAESSNAYLSSQRKYDGVEQREHTQRNMTFLAASKPSNTDDE